MQNKKQLFEQFITQNIDNAYRFAYTYVKNTKDAEDVVSESVVKALSSLSSLKTPQYIKSWFFRIIINTSLTQLQKNKRTVCMDPADYETVITGVNFEPIPDVDLNRAIDSLPEKYRTIIVLRYFEDFSLQEIAAALDLNLNTVKTRLYKALKLLKLDLEEAEVQ